MSAFPTLSGIPSYTYAVSALDKIERASQSLDKAVEKLDQQDGSTEDRARFARLATLADNLAADLRHALTEIEAEASKEVV